MDSLHVYKNDEDLERPREDGQCRQTTSPGGVTAEAKSSRDVLAVGDWKGPRVRMGNFHRKRTGHRAWQPVTLEKSTARGSWRSQKGLLDLPELTHSTAAFFSWAWWDRPLIPAIERLVQDKLKGQPWIPTETVSNKRSNEG